MRRLACVLALAFAAGNVHAQAAAPQAAVPAAAAPDAAPEWSPRTGDAWVDAVLADINAYARRYPDAFADELERYRGAPRADVAALLADDAWAPGDVYFACALAQAIGRSCRYVAGEREEHPDEGWGALAQRLGVAPGSPDFHALKDGFTGAYARWARPLPPPVATDVRKPGKSKTRAGGKAANKPAARTK